ncbi:helix-turn-helix domain-containing protein [Pannonibacter carbonis]|uniref:helix-turn-helix domain-containing protein n=1 Tax=Pannonibacter carbonis TaxID=2067569 RepID=UPI000D0E3B2F|nr:helix-turn-helix domain-containing protein [Pannonibacter carbonis]
MEQYVYSEILEVFGQGRCRVSRIRANEKISRSIRSAEILVTEFYGVPQEDLMQETRGRKNVACARQVMMYMAHITFGLTLGEVGRLYNRDRSTVGYACRKMEDLRDNPCHDRMLEQFERAIRDMAVQDRIAVDGSECRVSLCGESVR